MKVYIWVHKSDAISGTVTDYNYTRPYHDRNDEWVQVSISVDDFAQLEDISKPEENLFKDEEAMIFERNPDTGEVKSRKPGDYENTKPVDNVEYYKIHRSDSWRVSQYNRNRDANDQIDDVDDIDQNNVPFGD